jgi:hypothetical protein
VPSESTSPIYKRWWFWIVVVVLVIVLVGILHYTKVINITPNDASGLGRILHGTGLI